MIQNNSIANVRDAARIEEVVGEFINLKRAGSNFKALCPFHNEDTPSFLVSPSKGIFKCFGCGKGGDSINFVMEHESMTYVEAIRYLASKYGITLEETENTPEAIEEKSLHESLFAVNSFAADFYKKHLWETDEGKTVGLSYFRERDFTDAAITDFALGYAPSGWHNLLDNAKDAGYKVTYLRELGLVKGENDKTYDALRERVIFPIQNITGRVIGFGGRVLNSEEKTAKYINSPESPIYNKSKVLYGIFQAKTAIVKANKCYLVEGYTDVIALHQSGIKNVVASSGTALTSDQIRLIKRFTSNITILYDSDTAGLKASNRGINMILEAGMQVNIVLFEAGEDPDSFTKKNDSSRIKHYLENNEKTFIRFKAELLAEQSITSPIEKAEGIRDIVESIALVYDGIARSLYVKEAAQMLEMEESALLSELNKTRRKNFYADQRKKNQSFASEQADVADNLHAEPQALTLENQQGEDNEFYIIKLIVNYGNQSLKYPLLAEESEKTEYFALANIILAETKETIEWQKPARKKFFKFLAEFIENDNDLAELQRHLRNHADEEIRHLLAEAQFFAYEISPYWEEELNIYTETEADLLEKSVYNGLLDLQLKKLNHILSEKKKDLKEINDDDATKKCLKAIYTLEKRKKEMAALRKRVVLK